MAQPVSPPPRRSDDDPLKEKTGIRTGDLIRAPLEPPDVEPKGGPNHHQYRSIAVGLLIMALGIVLWLILNGALGVTIVLIGVVFVIIGTLVRL